MINDKILMDLGLESYENGYYQLTEDIIVDVEGDVRLELTHEIVWLGHVENLSELKILIEILNR